MIPGANGTRSKPAAALAFFQERDVLEIVHVDVARGEADVGGRSSR